MPIYTYEVDHGDESPAIGAHTEINGGKIIACQFNAVLENSDKAREILETHLEISYDLSDETEFVIKQAIELL